MRTTGTRGGEAMSTAPVSEQTVLLATGAALVGVVAGFFVMLHLAGGAAGASASRRPNDRSRR
jgi:hypothetical protein